MDMCNEAEGQSAAKLNDTATPTTAATAATVIEPTAAPSKTPQLIEMPPPELASVASPIESEKTAGSKTDGLEKGADSTDRSMPRSGRFAMLAASLAVAAGLGAVAGALGASLVAPTAATPAPGPVVSSTDADETQSLKATVAQLRADLSALRVTIETANKAASGQLAKITERIERERRADTGASKETTGSLLTGPAAAPAAAPLAGGPAAAPPTVAGWAVRDVYRGVALIQGPRRGLIEVEAGDVIPGIGRVESIRKQDGHWIVTTSRGIIASR
jgi:hypothetical protein